MKLLLAKKNALVVIFVLLCTFTFISGRAYAADAGGTTPCQPSKSVFGLPTWYKYLNGQRQADEFAAREICQPTLEGLDSIWKIVAAVIEMLLRVAMLVAIGMVVYGGVLYTISQGSPDKTKQALKTIISALVGLAIALIATVLVSFIAGRFTQDEPVASTTSNTTQRNGPQ